MKSKKETQNIFYPAVWLEAETEQAARIVNSICILLEGVQFITSVALPFPISLTKDGLQLQAHFKSDNDHFKHLQVKQSLFASDEWLKKDRMRS